MKRMEKCLLAVDLGYKYLKETGAIIKPDNKELTEKMNRGYIIIRIRFKNKEYKLLGHHFAWYSVFGNFEGDIDHKNRKRTDNRIDNLRLATTLENSFNRSNVKGYSWVASANKWRAYIIIYGKFISLGRFEKEEDAKNAYLIAKDKYHIIGELDKVKENFDKFLETSKKGYCWDSKMKKWRASLTVNKVRYHLGFFEKEEDARKAYIDAKEHLL